jgi:hypothetical protein
VEIGSSATLVDSGHGEVLPATCRCSWIPKSESRPVNKTLFAVVEDETKIDAAYPRHRDVRGLGSPGPGSP